MIRRTYEQCIKAVDSKDVYVATDSDQIFEHCSSLGMQVVLTSQDCLTGTDRVAEFSEIVKADYYINVQGDEPFMNPADLTKMVKSIDDFQGEILNGFSVINDPSLYESRSIPKLVMREDKRLLYMSRSPIPGNKSGSFKTSWRPVSYTHLTLPTNREV